MNRWAPEWGKNGMAWVPYPVFDHFAKEAYAVYPQGEGVDVKPTRFDIRFGFVDNATKKNIPLRNTGGNVFRSTTTVAKGAKFKIEVTNNAECYTYVFGQEADGSTYVLFPYTPKHSPYCGITGTRIFPSEQSLMADDEGQREEPAARADHIGAVLSAPSQPGPAGKLRGVGQCLRSAHHRLQQGD
ncbi:MAG: DUF4384 domain-containing protein, partial [Flavobacteriales bacterium]